MNVLQFFFLSASVISAAPTSNNHQHKSGKQVNSQGQGCQPQYLEGGRLLMTIIDHVKILTLNLTEEMLQKKVQNVFRNEDCSCVKLCQAGKVLSAYNASALGLSRARDWRLPRILHSFSNECTRSDKQEDIPLRQLLHQIRNCAKKANASK